MEPDGGASAVLITAVAETGSTNADLLALARAGAGEGAWFRAERQTAGRGRQGRIWASPPGNLYASTLVRLRRDDPPAATLALVAGVAVEEAVAVFVEQTHANGEAYSAAASSRPAAASARLAAEGPGLRRGDEPDYSRRPGEGRGIPEERAPVAAGGTDPRHQDALALKWPNDLLLGNAKLAGILLERADDAVVVGVGANLAHHPDLADRPATSLAAHGITVAPATAAEVLADTFARWLARWRGEGLAPVRARWLDRAHPVGTALTVRTAGDPPLDGLFDGLAEDGALLLRLASGERRVIHAGDVFLL